MSLADLADELQAILLADDAGNDLPLISRVRVMQALTAVYAAMTADRQAETLEKIEDHLNFIAKCLDGSPPELETIVAKLSRIGSIILDK